MKTKSLYAALLTAAVILSSAGCGGEQTTTSKITAAGTVEATVTEATRECECCGKTITEDDGVISPLGVFMCPDCQAAGLGGTTPPNEAAAELTTEETTTETTAVETTTAETTMESTTTTAAVAETTTETTTNVNTTALTTTAAPETTVNPYGFSEGSGKLTKALVKEIVGGKTSYVGVQFTSKVRYDVYINGEDTLVKQTVTKTGEDPKLTTTLTMDGRYYLIKADVVKEISEDEALLSNMLIDTIRGALNFENAVFADGVYEYDGKERKAEFIGTDDGGEKKLMIFVYGDDGRCIAIVNGEQTLGIIDYSSKVDTSMFVVPELTDSRGE